MFTPSIRTCPITERFFSVRTSDSVWDWIGAVVRANMRLPLHLGILLFYGKIETRITKNPVLALETGGCGGWSRLIAANVFKLKERNQKRVKRR